MLNDPKKPLPLFAGFGIELEFMIIAADGINVKAISDQILAELSGQKGAREFVAGPVAWSNEFVKHVLELKSNGPANDLVQLKKDFRSAIAAMNQLLQEKFQARLLATAMHPLFDPETETEIWQGDDAAIYATYDRIFGWPGATAGRICRVFISTCHLLVMLNSVVCMLR